MKGYQQTSSDDSKVKFWMELSYPQQWKTFFVKKITCCENLTTEEIKQTRRICNMGSDYIDLTMNDRVHHVELKGRLFDVERTRARIRDLMPVEFIIGCRADRVNSLGIELLAAHFSATFSVNLIFNFVEEDASYQARIRGYRHRLEGLKEAVFHFCHIVQTPSESLEMEIAASDFHVSLIQFSTQFLEEKSGARICCPEYSNLILVRGSFSDVFHACEIITGLTPVHLEFLCSSPYDFSYIRSLSQIMDINISVGKENIVSRKRFILSTFESNARRLYELRRICLHLQKDSIVLPKLRPFWTDLIKLHKNSVFLIKNVSSDAFTFHCEEHVYQGRRNTQIGNVLKKKTFATSTAIKASTLRKSRSVTVKLPQTRYIVVADQIKRRKLHSKPKDD